MTIEQKVQANRLIAELLGVKRECRASQLYRVEECGTGLEDCNNCKHNRYPDYCGNDNDALDAIKELAGRGISYNIAESQCPDVPDKGVVYLEFFTFHKHEPVNEWEPVRICLGKGDTLHDAFKAAMVEDVE